MSYRSVIPSLLGLDRCNSWDYPLIIRDQPFGLGYLSDEDFFPPRIYGGYLVRPQPKNTVEKKSFSGLSEVTNTSNKFAVSMDVSHFQPEDITVKTLDNYVMVHAKHEEKTDEHGFVSREFTRKYLLPNDVKPETVASSISSDGVLTVEAPKIKDEQLGSKERIIPVLRKDILPSVTSQEKHQILPDTD